MKQTVIVIGAGMAGLSAALRLAKSGFTVTVLEKNAQIGGLHSDICADGFCWQLAPPSFLPMRALSDLFAELEWDMADSLHWRSLQPQLRYFFADGTVFDIKRDWVALMDAVARIGSGDAAGLLRFMARAADMQQAQERMEAKSSKGRGQRMAWLHAEPLHSLHQLATRYLSSSKLQHVIEHFATWLGGSAAETPAAAAALIHDAMRQGNCYPQRGMAGLHAALLELAQALQVNIQLQARVQGIVVEGGRARGLYLDNEQLQRADVILSTVDPVTTSRFLLPPGSLALPRMRRMLQQAMSSSAYVLLLGMRGRSTQLAAHNIILPADPRRANDELFKRGILPSDPTITLSITSKSEPLHAPLHQENWRVQVDVPPLSEKIDWAVEAPRLRKRLLRTLKERTGVDIEASILVERQLLPADFQQMTGAWRGALHGPSPHGRLPLRTVGSMDALGIERLYFTGGRRRFSLAATMGLDAGKSAAARICQDLL